MQAHFLPQTCPGPSMEAPSYGDAAGAALAPQVEQAQARSFAELELLREHRRVLESLLQWL